MVRVVQAPASDMVFGCHFETALSVAHVDNVSMKTYCNAIFLMDVHSTTHQPPTRSHELEDFQLMAFQYVPGTEYALRTLFLRRVASVALIVTKITRRKMRKWNT